MNKAEAPEEAAAHHPRHTTTLYGHREAEAMLLDTYRGGAMPHAWLIGGASGIGKATLAYRLARFVLAYGDPVAPEVQAAPSLAVDPAHPVARQVAAGAHGGLLTLERVMNDRGVLNTVITVDQVRRTTTFFGSTAAAEGWRVCVVDSVEELNTNAANALLKVLEEPPPRSLFLLVSRAPSRVLPTIQSRCRKLLLRPLDVSDLAQAAAEASGVAADDPALVEAAAASEGSVGRALMLLGGDALALRERTMALLDALPDVDGNALHALGDALTTSDRAALATVMDTLEHWVATQLRRPDAAQNLPRLARLGEVWDNINRSARETETFNLERKPLVFVAFGLLSEVTR
jgi:DNA polymerase-3 subunit delta'